jgi:hypothetical protein
MRDPGPDAVSCAARLRILRIEQGCCNVPNNAALHGAHLDGGSLGCHNVPHRLHAGPGEKAMHQTCSKQSWSAIDIQHTLLLSSDLHLACLPVALVGARLATCSWLRCLWCLPGPLAPAVCTAHPYADSQVNTPAAAKLQHSTPGLWAWQQRWHFCHGMDAARAASTPQVAQLQHVVCAATPCGVSHTATCPMQVWMVCQARTVKRCTSQQLQQRHALWSGCEPEGQELVHPRHPACRSSPNPYLN